MPTSDGAADDFLVSDGSGSWSFSGGPARVAKTTTYTATTADKVLTVATSSAWTLTLYTAVGNAGRTLKIIKVSGDFNALTVDGNGSESINGNATTSLNTQWETLEIISDGSNWNILNRCCDTARVSFTPTGAFTTNTTYTGYKQRISDCYVVEVKLSFAGAPNVTTFAINIPDSLTMDTAKMITDTDGSIHGTAHYVDAGTVSSISYGLQYNTTTSLHIGGTGGDWSWNVPITWANTDEMYIKFTVPITGWKSQNT